MNKVLTRGIITIAAVNDGKDGHSLTAKAFIEGSYRNGFTKGVKSYVKVFYDGQEVKDFKVSYRYKGAGQADWVKPQTNKEDSWTDAQRDGSTLFVEYVAEYKGLTAVATGRLDNIQDGRDAVGYALVPLVERAEAYIEDDKKKWVDVRLVYRVRKSVGERVSFVTDLAAEDMTLKVSGGLGGFKAHNGVFGLQSRFKYEERPLDSYAVTLTKGVMLVDRRVLPITFKPKVVFDIDAENGEIRRNITNVKGDMNSFKATINETSNTVGNLSKEFTQMKQTSKEISMTVNNGTRPNLLWGSDLNLDGVDTTSKEAIEKRLGVGLSATRVESKEWFEYLKGGGVGGADAIKAKVAAVNGEGNYYAGLYWQIGFGAKSNVKVKPNTKYTFSFWIRTEILQGRGYAVAESFNMESLTGGRKDSTMPWTTVPAKNEWERMSYTFTTGATGYIMVGVGLSGEDNFSELIYLCHPKLEEGDTATPWCAYDGTVDALLESGFDIKEKKYTATSDNFVVQNNRGEQTFMVDENGALRSIDTSGKGCIVLRPHAGYISILDTETGKDRAMVNKFGIYAIGVRGNDITLDTSDKTGKRAAFDISGMFRVECFSDKSIGERLDITMDSLPYIGDNSLQQSQLYIDGKNNLKINTGEPTVKLLHPNESYVMKSTDATIVADTKPNNDVWITLPEKPSVGMEVVIINTGTGWCYLKTDGFSKIFWDEVKTEEFVRQHTKISLLYVGGSDGLWIYVTEGLCGVRQ